MKITLLLLLISFSSFADYNSYNCMSLEGDSLVIDMQEKAMMINGLGQFQEFYTDALKVEAYRAPHTYSVEKTLTRSTRIEIETQALREKTQEVEMIEAAIALSSGGLMSSSLESAEVVAEANVSVFKNTNLESETKMYCVVNPEGLSF